MHFVDRLSPRTYLSASQTEKLASVLLAFALVAIGFGAKGGLLLKRITWIEIVATIGAVLFYAVCLLAKPKTELKIGFSGGLLLGFSALVFASISWSIQPENSWLEANRTLTYALVFCAAIIGSQKFDSSWRVVLRAALITSITFTVFALMTKVFPEKLARDALYARLREPFDYWNATGLIAALGIPGFLWLGGRRTGHGGMNGLAYPGLFLSLLTIFLSYSRGALLAAFMGVVLWFIFTPRRLRAFAVLFVGSFSALLVARWVFGQDGLTVDQAPLDLRSAAGHQFGVLVLTVSLATTFIGWAVEFIMTDRRLKPETRQTLGIIILVFVSLILVFTAVGLTFTQRGLDGTVRYVWQSVTDPDALQPANTPGRFTEAGSVRARYWDEALKTFKESKLIGTGGGTYVNARLRYQTGKTVVVHAHSFIFQTLADFGLAGISIVVLLIIAWFFGFVKISQTLKKLPAIEHENKRIGILTLGMITVTFGIHSAIDWTWYEPTIAFTSLLCAGCVTGYSIKACKEHRKTSNSWRGTKFVVTGGVIFFTITAAWSFWQPLRAFQISQSALQLNEHGKYDQAVIKAKKAVKVNPLSLDPLFNLAAIKQGHGRINEARKILEKAVRLQPANVQSWLALGQFELTTSGQPQRAASIAQIAIYLDPQSPEPVALLVQAEAARQQEVQNTANSLEGLKSRSSQNK